MNLGLLLEMATEGFGHRVALGSMDDGLTYDDVRGRAAAAGHRAALSGTKTMALAAPNGPVVPVVLFGAATAGLVYAPLNYRLPPAHVHGLIERLDSPLLVGPPELAPIGTAGGAITAEDLLAGRAAPPPSLPNEGDPDAVAVLLFTSGTAAEPKAALLRHRHLAAYVLATVEFGSAGEDEANLLAVPPFHVAGVAAVLSSCYAGRRLVPLDVFTPEAWLALAHEEAVTHAFVVPTMLARIVATMERDGIAPPPTLRSLAYGGARLPLPVLERALRLFPTTGFVNAYGLTETSSTVAVLGPDEHRHALESDDPAVRRRLQSAGRPLPGVEVAIRDGEIWIRGEQVAGEYADSSGLRGRDGWLPTGDAGRLEDGYLFVLGRADDLIIRGGENISPAEVEDCLLSHPAVASAGVVGLPDPEWGERVAAVVVARDGASLRPDELRAWAAERLGSLKAPEVVVVRDDLPVTDTGKVLRRVLRAELAVGLSP